MSVARFFSVKNKFAQLQTSLSAQIKLPEKLKGTVIERWGIYWKSLMNDYADVGRGALQTAKDKPVRTSVLCASGLIAYLCAKNNPDHQSLMEKIRKRNCDMVLVHESCQRAESANHLKMLERLMNHGTLRTFNLGVVTLVWEHDFNKDLCTYKAVCSFLQPEYTTFHERIIDVGFWNKWWNLDKKMIDYDVAEN